MIPLPPTVSCFSKIEICFACLVPAGTVNYLWAGYPSGHPTNSIESQTESQSIDSKWWKSLIGLFSLHPSLNSRWNEHCSHLFWLVKLSVNQRVYYLTSLYLSLWGSCIEYTHSTNHVLRPYVNLSPLMFLFLLFSWVSWCQWMEIVMLSAQKINLYNQL